MPDGHVAEMGGRHVLAHHRLEVEHVDGILRRLDQVRGIERRPRQRVGQLRLRQQRLGEGELVGVGERGAGGDELQKPAPVGGLIEFVRHVASSHSAGILYGAPPL